MNRNSDGDIILPPGPTCAKCGHQPCPCCQTWCDSSPECPCWDDGICEFDGAMLDAWVIKVTPMIDYARKHGLATVES